MTITDGPDDRPRLLRAIYREVGEQSYAPVAAECDRLYPGEDRPLLANILQSACAEGRELAGWRCDTAVQS